MRPRLLRRQDLISELRRKPLVSSSELAASLGVSQPTISRGLSSLDDQVVKIGRTRSAQYALLREVGRFGTRWPLFCIDEHGRPRELGVLHALQQGHWYLESDLEIPVLKFGEFERAVFPDFPWFLDDQRPQGFLGRAFAQAHAEALGAPPDIQLWNSDHVLAAVLTHGDNLPGNLVLGDQALESALEEIARPTALMDLEARSRQFPELAAMAVRGQSVGSSAGGEQPKFTICIDEGDGTFQSAIVKFTEPRSTPSAIRWADLLQCEHLAGKVLAESGIPSAPTHVVDAEGRRFLQSQRFDRTATLGRRGYVSLRAMDAAFFGRARAPWTEMADLLLEGRWIEPGCGDWMKISGLFGDLIGNNDMHFGNIAFELRETQPLSWVPLFDMLPMLYAPTSAGAIVERAFEPKPPHPRYYGAWKVAASLAEDFWARVARDQWISPDFRSIASENRGIVTDLRDRFD